MKFASSVGRKLKRDRETGPPCAVPSARPGIRAVPRRAAPPVGKKTVIQSCSNAVADKEAGEPFTSRTEARLTVPRPKDRAARIPICASCTSQVLEAEKEVAPFGS